MRKYSIAGSSMPSYRCHKPATCRPRPRGIFCLTGKSCRISAIIYGKKLQSSPLPSARLQAGEEDLTVVLLHHLLDTQIGELVLYRVTCSPINSSLLRLCPLSYQQEVIIMCFLNLVWLGNILLYAKSMLKIPVSISDVFPSSPVRAFLVTASGVSISRKAPSQKRGSSRHLNTRPYLVILGVS